MTSKIYTNGVQFMLALALYIFSISCQGPLEDEKIEFITPNIYENLSSKATRVVMKTEKSNWKFENVQYNDTIANLSAGKIYKIDHDEVIDPSFSYTTRTVNNQWVAEITGSFFSIIAESPSNKNEPTVITVDVTENTSKEKRVLRVELLNLDTGSYFRIEQNPE